MTTIESIQEDKALSKAIKEIQLPEPPVSPTLVKAARSFNTVVLGHLSAEERVQLISEYQKTRYSTQELAQKYNVSTQQIYDYMSYLKIRRPQGTPRRLPTTSPHTDMRPQKKMYAPRVNLTKQQEKELIKQYKQSDIPARELANQYGLALQQLYQFMSARKIKRPSSAVNRGPKGPRLTEEQKEAALKDYVAGMDIDEIEKKHTISRKSLYVLASRRGIVRNQTVEEIIATMLETMGQQKKDEIINFYYQQGNTIESTAQHFAYTPILIKRIVEEDAKRR